MGVALQALNRETGQLDTFVLNDRQAEELGLPQDPEVLGCGTMACAYASGDDKVAKITSDVLDARMSYIVMENPQPWAIPIHGVWSLPDNRYAILAARAEPLTIDPPLAMAIDQLYDNVLKLKITDEQWDAFRDTTEANIADDIAEEGETVELEALTVALALIDEAVKGFARLGMGWMDFHSGNWGIYEDRPVVIDLGLSRPLTAPPVQALERDMGLEPLGSSYRASEYDRPEEATAEGTNWLLQAIEDFANGGSLRERRAAPDASKMQGQAIFMVGSPAAGKTTWALKHHLAHPAFTHIDADEWKKQHPDYDPKLPGLVHAWSSEMANQQFDEILPTGESFVRDGTGSHLSSMIDQIERAQEAGYTTTLIYVYAPLEVALDRAARRERLVPEELVRQKHAEADTNFAWLSKMVDNVRVVESEKKQR